MTKPILPSEEELARVIDAAVRLYFVVGRNATACGVPVARAVLAHLAPRVQELESELQRLTAKYEASGLQCHKGHVNNLPLALWDCPICVEDLRRERDEWREIVSRLVNTSQVRGEDLQEARRKLEESNG